MGFAVLSNEPDPKGSLLTLAPCSVSLERILQTVGIVKHTVGIEEKGVRLRLNIIDTPGFGDAVNNTQR